MRPMCRMVQVLAPSEGALGAPLVGHVDTCLACQAEIARYGRLRRQLAALADVTVAAPKPLAAAVTAAIASSDAASRAVPTPSQAARVIAAAGAVTAAAGAVAVALWRHSRPAVR
jgi:hypothetical protein